METKDQTERNFISTEMTHTPVPQMQVRSDVRSGGDLETCQYNLNKWKDRYYYWYNVARQNGKI